MELRLRLCKSGDSVKLEASVPRRTKVFKFSRCAPQDTPKKVFSVPKNIELFKYPLTLRVNV